jgi:hypothetical protein
MPLPEPSRRALGDPPPGAINNSAHRRPGSHTVSTGIGAACPNIFSPPFQLPYPQESAMNQPAVAPRPTELAGVFAAGLVPSTPLTTTSGRLRGVRSLQMGTVPWSAPLPESVTTELTTCFAQSVFLAGPSQPIGWAARWFAAHGHHLEGSLRRTRAQPAAARGRPARHVRGAAPPVGARARAHRTTHTGRP